MTTKAKRTSKKATKPAKAAPITQAFDPRKYKAPAAATKWAQQVSKDLSTVENGREALARSIKHVLSCFKGKRTEESITVLARVLEKKYGCKFRITKMLGMINARFYTGKEGTKSEKKHEAASSCWKKYISPSLPGIKKASHGKAKRGRVDHAARVESNFTATLKNHKSITLAQARKLATDAWYAAHPRSAK